MAIRQRITVKKKIKSKIKRISDRKVNALFPHKSVETGYTNDFEELVSKVTTQQLINPFVGNDLFVEEVNSQFVPIEPIFDFIKLAEIYLQSNILRQCVESYVVNIESYGHVLEYIGPEGSIDSDESVKEKQEINAFFANISAMDSFADLRSKSRIDREVLGNRAFEVIRDRRGRIVRLEHVPVGTLRMTKRDRNITVVSVIIRNSEDGGFTRKNVERHFRRFVQVQIDGLFRKVYFKEFGDPRKINPVDGMEDSSISFKNQATEILWESTYTPGTVYGTPRWVGSLPALLGSRESEMVNLNFFRDNAIPAMVILVSGGALTEESFYKVEQYINAVRGQRSMNRVMILEAAADEHAGDIEHSQPAPKIDMKPMISERQQEGLFQDYDQKNMQKVRSSFRLPPIYVGRAEDYTRASAFASMLVAESQIFAPERQTFDKLINEKVLITMKPRFWKFKSLGPSTAEPEAVSKMLDAFGKHGSLTPNAVIKIANRMLDVDIESITEEWGDSPFSIIMEYVRQGREIKGLEGFIGELLDNTDENSLNDNPEKDVGNNVVPIRALVKRIVNKEMRIMTEEIRDTLEEFKGLQTFATE